VSATGRRTNPVERMILVIVMLVRVLDICNEWSLGKGLEGSREDKRPAGSIVFYKSKAPNPVLGMFFFSQNA
jgi:hypothetical protein